MLTAKTVGAAAAVVVVLGALAVAGVVALVPKPAPVTPAPVTLAPPKPPPGSSLVPPSTYFPHSVFNSTVTGWPVASGSSGLVADFVSDYQTDYGVVDLTTQPLYWVPADQPGVAMSVRPGCNDFLASTGATVPVPSALVQLNGSGDDPLTLYQPSSGFEWEFWQAQEDSPTQWLACWGGKMRMATSTGVFPAGYGRSATGISELATMITEADVESGTIDHALGVTLPRCNSWVYPADRGDCGADPGQPSEGQWFRFPAGLSCPPRQCTTPLASMVFRAIQEHGMVVTDQGGGVTIAAEQSQDWTAEGHAGTDPITAALQGQDPYTTLTQLPWAQLQVVTPPPA